MYVEQGEIQLLHRIQGTEENRRGLLHRDKYVSFEIGCTFFRKSYCKVRRSCRRYSDE